jgi:hypothetical protein
MAPPAVYAPPPAIAGQPAMTQALQPNLLWNPAAQVAGPMQGAGESQAPAATWFRSPGPENAAATGMGVAEQAAPPPLPPVYRLGPPAFGGPTGTASPGPTAPPQLSASLSERITRIARAGGVQTPAGISVYLGNGSAVLRGAVGTPYDRQLVANLVRLEPRVWRVENQLTVQSGGAATGSNR